MQRHLAAFETLDPHAGPGRLTLSPAPPGLARSGAGTAADARAFFAGTGAVSEFVKFHSAIPSFAAPSLTLPRLRGRDWEGVVSRMRTKCLTLVSMPRMAGVSGTCATRPMRVRPSPINVLRCV